MKLFCFLFLLTGCQEQLNQNNLDHIDQLIANHQFEQAISICGDKDDLEATLRKARAYKGLKQYENAESTLKQYGESDASGRIQQEFAELNLLMGNPVKAYELYNSIKEYSTLKKSVILNGLGVSLDYQGHHVAAQGQYHKALKLSPGNKEIMSNLGLSYAFSNDFKKSLKLLEPLTDTIQHRHNLALVYAMTHRLDKYHNLLSADMDKSTRIELLEQLTSPLK